jgi:acyl carrier protein
MNALSATGSLTPEKLAAMVVEVIVDRFEVDPEKVTREARLAEDLLVDSLGFVELTLALEERLYRECQAECAFDIPEGEETKWVTVGDVIDVVVRLVNEAAPGR